MTVDFIGNEGKILVITKNKMSTLGTHIEVVRKHNTQTGSGNGETLLTANAGKGYGVVYYDPGAARTGVILEAGRENGQTVHVVNIADADELVTFAAAGTSNVAGGTAVAIEQNRAAYFIWDATTELWYPVHTPVAAA